FAGYIADIRCGLTLRGHGKEVLPKYYKDVANLRRLPCSAGGYLHVRAELVQRQFGELLACLRLTDTWREEVRQRVISVMDQAGVGSVDIARERERLRLKRNRILKQHREGFIEDEE